MILGPVWGILAARGGAFPAVARRRPRGGARVANSRDTKNSDTTPPGPLQINLFGEKNMFGEKHIPLY